MATSNRADWRRRDVDTGNSYEPGTDSMTIFSFLTPAEDKERRTAEISESIIRTFQRAWTRIITLIENYIITYQSILED